LSWANARPPPAFRGLSENDLHSLLTDQPGAM
jgi:hypothetical protein